MELRTIDIWRINIHLRLSRFSNPSLGLLPVPEYSSDHEQISPLPEREETIVDRSGFLEYTALF